MGRVLHRIFIAVHPFTYSKFWKQLFRNSIESLLLKKLPGKELVVLTPALEAALGALIEADHLPLLPPLALCCSR